jgi:hypothetical protein
MVRCSQGASVGAIIAIELPGPAAGRARAGPHAGGTAWPHDCPELEASGLTDPKTGFYAMSPAEPWLKLRVVLRQRTTRSSPASGRLPNEKARELGWIVKD